MPEIMNTGKNWHERYKAMKKGLGWTNKDVARESGNTPDSIKNATHPANEIPRMLKLAIVVYERLSAKEGGEK